ncbi:MAG: hypothetical protein ABL957_15120, partial [Parvularculaceae bacterium]
LRASLEGSRRAGAAGYVHKKKEAAFERALADARARLAAAPHSSARDLLVRYAADIERLAARRFAFAPDEALGWLAAIETRLKAYATRMSAMVAAARSSGDMDEIAARLAEAGLSGIDIAAVSFRSDGPQGAWRLSATRA